MYAGSVDSASSKSQSIGGSSQGKPPSNASSNKGPGNLVRDNLLKKNVPSTANNKNNLLKTSPNINLNQHIKKTSIIPERNINTSHEIPKGSIKTNNKLFQTQKYRDRSES